VFELLHTIKTKSMKTKFTLILITAGLFFTTATMAQSYAYNHNTKNDRRDIYHDKVDIARDNAHVNYDKHELYHDEAFGNHRDVRVDKYELNRDRRDRFNDHRDLRFDRRDLRHDYYFKKRCL
jgi:hypothetical protein